MENRRRLRDGIIGNYIFARGALGFLRGGFVENPPTIRRRNGLGSLQLALHLDVGGRVSLADQETLAACRQRVVVLPPG